jgi:hypothetical protein
MDLNIKLLQESKEMFFFITAVWSCYCLPEITAVWFRNEFAMFQNDIFSSQRDDRDGFSPILI